MGKPIIVSAIMTFMLACSAEPAEDDDIPGKLEHEDMYSRLYRLDRRVDVVYKYEREDGLEGKCGILTDRAYDELESTLAAIDPSVDYGEHRPDCDTHGVLVHVENFEHSPFACTYECCHPDLAWAALVYTMILNNFFGGYPTIDGEPYVAIDPDQPCP